MKKEIVAAVGIITLPLLGYLVQKFKNNPQQKNKQNQLYVGVELGGTNYNVAVAEPVVSNQGDIIDFKIIKRKNGKTY